MIYIVGAGIGDAGLLTLRAYEILKRTDIVIYDRLIGEGILALIPENAQKIDAGKSPNNHKLSQEKIESLMIELSKTNKIIVRLKGGDPFVFGRGGEEAQALIKAGIKFEIIPGITSAISAPEYAGIPVTHRNYCSGINIYTAHDKNNLIPDFNNTTSIFLMGIANSFELQEKLLLSMNPNTPCAVIENASRSNQRVFRTKLSSLHECIINNQILPPAVIITGQVTSLNLNWRDNLQLNGKRIIITRPAGKNEYLASKLRDYGAEVISMPTIKTSVIHDSLNNLSLSNYDWIGFTSVTGVEAFFELLKENNRDIRELGNAKIAAIGKSTADSLNSHGLKVDFIPQIFDGINLAEGLSKISGNILMFRALNGSPEIEKILNHHKIRNKQVYIYRTDYVKLFHVPNFSDIIIFTSASTVKGLCSNTDKLRDSLAVCIGNQTAEEAMKSGFKKIKIAEQASIDSILDEIISCTR